jgi:hypothetical protein
MVIHARRLLRERNLVAHIEGRRAALAKMDGEEEMPRRASRCHGRRYALECEAVQSESSGKFFFAHKSILK